MRILFESLDFSALPLAASTRDEQMLEDMSKVDYIIELFIQQYDTMFWLMLYVPTFLVMAWISLFIVIEYVMIERKKTWASEKAIYDGLLPQQKFGAVMSIGLIIATIIAFFIGMAVFWWSEWWKDVKIEPISPPSVQENQISL